MYFELVSGRYPGGSGDEEWVGFISGQVAQMMRKANPEVAGTGQDGH